MMKRLIDLFTLLTLLLCCHTAVALTFRLQSGSDIIGKVQYATVQRGESLSNIGRRFDVGVYEMIEANPKLNPWAPRMGTKVTIPTRFILPPGSRKGIVLNLAELRLYYFHPDKKLVTTHPVGIGKKGWKTPIVTTFVIDKTVDPSWRPPKSIQEAYAKKGKTLPDIVPPGPKNPLGSHAIRLALPGYLVHGTNRPGGIGVRVTSGCIRLYPADIASLFHKVKIGTSFRIIHYPYKVGWHHGTLFVEIHEPLSEPYYSARQTLDDFKDKLKETIREKAPHLHLNWESTFRILREEIGYPIPLH